jgi:tetraacyldisaccharide 4'-kinase
MHRRMQACMQSPSQYNRTALEKTLWLLSRAYAGGIRARNKGFDNGLLRQRRLSCPVLSVGNLTVGGSGKTPMTVYLVEMLTQAGCRPAVISRGYKGKSEKAGGVVSDGRNVLLGPDQAGDEPFMMAMQLKYVPFLVGADRYAAGKLAITRFSPDIIVLDDAFQHRHLYRDMDLVLLDATVGFGNGYLLPRGILRETKHALHRADAVVLTRADEPAPLLEAEISKIVPRVPVIRSVNRPFVYGIARAGKALSVHMDHSAAAEDFRFLQSASVLGFSGIARSAEFQRMTADISGRLVDFLEFPDHYYYTKSDWHRILKRAEELSVDYLVTTQKDYARFQGEMEAPVDMVVIGIQMDFGPDRDALWGFIRKILGSGFFARKTDVS